MSWFGTVDSSTYTLLVAYFATNGVSYEDTDNLWWWGQNHLEELRNHYLCSKSPNMVAILSMVNADYGICDMNEMVWGRSCEYYSKLPMSSEDDPQDVALPSSGKCENNPLLQEQMEDAKGLHLFEDWMSFAVHVLMEFVL